MSSYRRAPTPLGRRWVTGHCGKRSRKGKKQIDLEDFLLATSDYMESRNEVVKTAREEAARITGQPLPAEKKSGPPGAE